MRAPDERLATLPDFFVAEVRLDAAAARFVVFLAAVLRAEAFTAVRLELRAADLRAVERAEDLRAADFAADLAEVFLAVVFLAAVFLAEDFAADLAEVFLAVVFFAVVFLAEDFAEDFAADLAVVFLAAVFLAAVFVPAFFVLLRAEEVLAFLALVLEPLLAPLFLVLVAPVSPVNNAVSGFLLSVGIAASFKGLRVQPSRLQGNVVIPSGFRLTESVESRTRTFSVDTLPG
ncbi:hypothetical protein [Microvirga sp. KLBC 81]|uniref:hypothetical protein n=1 Tax=Microvirga sp. KLBC 81 TaxID=1862707 RepID=UPI00197BCF2B|nr:hypothetical protein [Microvirga sp. KLBC 81]